MTTYMINPFQKENVIAVLKTVQIIGKNAEREYLKDFHLEKRKECTILYATDGVRLLKWETVYSILISEGAENQPGEDISSGTYRIITLDVKNGMVILEKRIESKFEKYPDCEAVISASHSDSSTNQILLDTKLLYELTKYFSPHVAINWNGKASPLTITMLDSIEGLILMLMPRSI